MATFPGKSGLYRTATGTTAQIRKYPEAASQSALRKGDFVTLSSGKVAIAVAASGTYASSDVEATAVLGMVLQDGTGTTDTPLSVVIANDWTEFLLPVIHTTPASAITAVTQVGTAYDLGNYTIGSVTTWGVMIDDTSALNFMVTEIDGTYHVGEQYGLVWGKIPALKRVFL